MSDFCSITDLALAPFLEQDHPSVPVTHHRFRVYMLPYGNILEVWDSVELPHPDSALDPSFVFLGYVTSIDKEGLMMSRRTLMKSIALSVPFDVCVEMAVAGREDEEDRKVA